MQVQKAYKIGVMGLRNAANQRAGDLLSNSTNLNSIHLYIERYLWRHYLYTFVPQGYIT
jgi:hypothetical protein